MAGVYTQKLQMWKPGVSKGGLNTLSLPEGRVRTTPVTQPRRGGRGRGFEGRSFNGKARALHFWGTRAPARCGTRLAGHFLNWQETFWRGARAPRKKISVALNQNSFGPFWRKGRWPQRKIPVPQPAAAAGQNRASKGRASLSDSGMASPLAMFPFLSPTD